MVRKRRVTVIEKGRNGTAGMRASLPSAGRVPSRPYITIAYIKIAGILSVCVVRR